MEDYTDYENEIFENWGYISTQKTDLKIIQLLLTKPNFFNPGCEYNKPLRMASFLGHADVVEILLQNPAVDPSDLSNRALCEAAERDHLPVVKILLEDSRVDPTQDNQAIYFASANGSLEMTQLLHSRSQAVNTSAKAIEAIYDEVSSPNETHFAVLDYLLSEDPSTQDNSALNWAVNYGAVSTTTLLLADGRVDPSWEDNWALIRALRNKYYDNVYLLVSDPRVDPSAGNNSAIVSAVKTGRLELVKRLLEDPRVDPACCFNLPLRFAAKEGRLEIVRLLLADARVDPAPVICGHADEKHTLCDENIREPLHEAIKNGHVEIAHLLLDDPRMNPNALQASMMATYLEFAMEKKFIPIVERLLNDPRLDLNSENPLVYAASEGLVEVVDLLLKHPRLDPEVAGSKDGKRGGADPGTLGNEALWLAAENGHVEIVRLLMKDQRVDPSACNNYLFKWAKQNGRLDVVEALSVNE
ncbi:ankyrin repeat-containing domain protein [Obelidium mucronatum]|nr:ankyrin repeat-containing domain protein [Obelidium mucronatum]